MSSVGGELEAAIMEQLWSAEDALTVRAVRELLAPERELAYTTVMTVLDNLHKKKLVVRELSGRAYAYRPVTSRAEHTAQLMAMVLGDSQDRSGVLLQFVGQMSTEDLEVLGTALRRARRDKRAP